MTILEMFVTDKNLPDIRLPAQPLIAKFDEDKLKSIGQKRISEMIQKGIRFHHADKMAVDLGYHPYEIWGQAFYQIDPNKNLVFAAKEILANLKGLDPLSIASFLAMFEFKSCEAHLRRSLSILIENGYVLRTNPCSSNKNPKKPGLLLISFIKDLED